MTEQRTKMNDLSSKKSAPKCALIDPFCHLPTNWNVNDIHAYVDRARALKLEALCFVIDSANDVASLAAINVGYPFWVSYLVQIGMAKFIVVPQLLDEESAKKLFAAVDKANASLGMDRALAGSARSLSMHADIGKLLQEIQYVVDIGISLQMQIIAYDIYNSPAGLGDDVAFIRGLCGIDVLSSRRRRIDNELALEMATARGLARFGSSQANHAAELNADAKTMILTHISTQKDYAQAIMKGKIWPVSCGLIAEETSWLPVGALRENNQHDDQHRDHDDKHTHSSGPSHNRGKAKHSRERGRRDNRRKTKRKSSYSR